MLVLIDRPQVYFADVVKCVGVTMWIVISCNIWVVLYTVVWVLRATARMAISAAGSKFPVVVDLPRISTPVPYCVYSCSRAWLGIGFASRLVHCRMGLHSVEPFHYELLPWSWLTRHWRADWLLWRSLLMRHLIFLPFQWGSEYWIAVAQWTAVIDAGAVPCTPTPHTPPPTAPALRHVDGLLVYCLSDQCTSVVTRQSLWCFQDWNFFQ